MDTARAPNPLPETQARDDARAAHDAGLIDNGRALWNDLRGLAHDQLRLAALEAQRAGESLVAIVAYGIVVGVLLAGAWLGAAIAFVLWLVGLGVGASAALLVAVLINLAGAVAFAVAIRRRSRYLRFPATVRSLAPVDEAAAAAERS